MYGQASKEVSEQLLEQRAGHEISKVESLFEDGKISVHYRYFQRKALELLEAENKAQLEAER